MATLVTGGTGFVGSNIVKTLAGRGHEVISLDLVPPDDMVRRYIEPWSDQVTFVQGDILDKESIEKAVGGHNVTRIVHAAVFTGIRPDIETERSRSIVDINVAGTANLLDLARGLSPERFLYVSSGSVYGEGRDVHEVLREDSALYPRTLYASTKYASELLTRRYGDLHGFQSVSVRLTSPYGPMERVTGHRTLMSVPYEWTRNVVRGEPIRVGDRSLGRDYSYVEDAASAICTVLDAPSLPHEVYNISAGPLINLGEMVKVLQDLRPSVTVIDDPSTELGLMRPGSVRGVMDSTRLQGDLGFRPKFDLTSGLEAYLQWRETSGFLD